MTLPRWPVTLFRTVQVKVHMAPSTVEVQIGERTVLQGSWYGEIKQEESTWYIQDGILHMQLLKRNRRGNYSNSSTNADTYWMSVGLHSLLAQMPSHTCSTNSSSTMLFAECCTQCVQSCQKYSHPYA